MIMNMRDDGDDETEDDRLTVMMLIMKINSKTKTNSSFETR